ncbi:TfoX/Sxy family protein [Marinobacter caseinilyticus]|uniref:TfoX/Sxy family protein n=1 Tax=Marinobacter caseinilyticus TaxID=2692195 RepID=UPI00140BA12C|nr:TfoX/Sxy family protein [Marinobacter caseinilyticus]
MTTEYMDYLTEVFREFGYVTARRMFGGYGVYHDGLMFGLVAADTLYLKADAANVAEFEQEGLPPFEFERNGKLIAMSYYQAPDAIMDDPELAAEWAQRSFDAARRARQAPAKRSANSPTLR